jgi:hypothetical protein
MLEGNRSIKELVLAYAGEGRGDGGGGGGGFDVFLTTCSPLSTVP